VVATGTGMFKQMFIYSTKTPPEFSRLATKKSGNEFRRFKRIILLDLLQDENQMSKQANSIMRLFFFFLSFNVEQAMGFGSLLLLSN
jgi:hypothetical protein